MEVSKNQVSYNVKKEDWDKIFNKEKKEEYADDETKKVG